MSVTKTSHNTHYEIIFGNKEHPKAYKRTISTLEEAEVLYDELVSKGCTISGAYVVTTSVTVAKLIADR